MPAPDAIGIIAGGGNLPADIASCITQRGGRVHIIAIDGQASNRVRAYPHTFLDMGKIGRAMKILREENLSGVVMVGKVMRPDLTKAKPDLGFFMALPAILRFLGQGGDDAMLRGVIHMFERRGFNVYGVGEVAPELLIEEGALGRYAPRPSDAEDIALGMRLIAELGPFDIGQAAIISDGRVETIEGAEGTDGMLALARTVRQSADANAGRGVLVKRPKPGQDLRVDLPAIGPDTVTGAAAAGLRGIAVMSGYVLTADRDAIAARADDHQMFVAGVTPAAFGDAPDRAAASSPAFNARMITMGKTTLPRASRRDAELATQVFVTLGAYNTGRAIIARRGCVLAVGATESAVDTLRRAGSRARRGQKALRGAVLVIAPGEDLTVDLIEAAASFGLVGIVALCDYASAISLSGAEVYVANRLGLSLAACEVREPTVVP